MKRLVLWLLIVLVATLTDCTKNSSESLNTREREQKVLSSHTGPVRGISGDLWADIIIGQKDFSEITTNEVVPNRFYKPGGAIIDRSSSPQILYVFDSGNSRILGFDWDECLASSTNPINVLPKIVIGQPNFYTSAANGDSNFQNYPEWTPASASTLNGLGEASLSLAEGGTWGSMAVDTQGNLYVYYFLNHRVLRYDTPFDQNSDQIADFVWGQDDFTGHRPNKGMSLPDATSFYYARGLENSGATGVEVDSEGNLWVADLANNRVLRFPPGSKIADLVLGQDSFTTRTPGNGLNKFSAPGSVRMNSQGWLYVTDQANHRVLRFIPPFTNGMDGEVFGPAFTRPDSLEFDPTEPGKVWISDPRGATIGLWDEGTQTLIKNLGGGDPNNVGSVTGSMGIDSAGNVILASNINRRYPHNGLLFMKGAATDSPSKLLFGVDLTSRVDPAGNLLTGNSLYAQVKGVVAFDNQLIVGEKGRILFWNDLASLTNGKPADGYASGFTDREINSFTDRDTACIAFKADKNHHLWVTTSGIRNLPYRFMVYQLPLVTGSQPFKVIGGDAGVANREPLPVLGGGEIFFNGITGIAPTDNSEFIWLSDTSNHRVLRVRNPLTNPVVDVILGQAGISATDIYPNRDPNWKSGQGPYSEDPKMLSFPGFLSLDNFGNLWVSDQMLEAEGNRRLLMFSKDLFPTDNTQVIFEPAATKMILSTSTWELAFNSQNQMVAGYNSYLSSPSPQAVLNVGGGRFPGFYSNPLGESTLPDGFLRDFHSMGFGATFDENDNLYMVDLNRGRVLIYKNPGLSTEILPTPTVSGPTSGDLGTNYTFSASVTTQGNALVRYEFDWADGTITRTGDGTATIRDDWFIPGVTATASHSWSKGGTFNVKIRAVDVEGAKSAWVELIVQIIDKSDLVIASIYGDTNGWFGDTRNHRVLITNQASGSTSAQTVLNVYLSYDEIVDGTDELIGTYSVPSLSFQENARIDYEVPIPTDWANRTVYVIAVIDSSDLDTSNNTAYKTIGLTKLQYDVNGDGSVTITDIFAVSGTFGAVPGDLNWNSSADVDGDGSTTVTDIFAVAGHFGDVDSHVELQASAGPTSGTVPLQVTFNYNAYYYEGSVTKVEIDFGDGSGWQTVATGSAPELNGSTSHWYTSVGSYATKIRATDSNGFVDTVNGPTIIVN